MDCRNIPSSRSLSVLYERAKREEKSVFMEAAGCVYEGGGLLGSFLECERSVWDEKHGDGWCGFVCREERVGR
jgi:hypothetical protein